MLPSLTDYVDSRNDSVQRLVDKLELSQDPTGDLKAIKEAVCEHVRLLSIKWFFRASVAFADQIYKTVNAASTWSTLHNEYLEATAGTFFKSFHEKGYVLHYWINNSFERTQHGMHNPLHLFPDLFRSVGLVYICPESLSLGLMKNDGIPSSQFLQHYPRYEDESRDVARLAIKECNQRKLSYVLLDLADDKQDLRNEMSKDPMADAETNVVTVFRHEAPVAGSNIAICLPQAAQ